MPLANMGGPPVYHCVCITGFAQDVFFLFKKKIGLLGISCCFLYRLLAAAKPSIQPGVQVVETCPKYPALCLNQPFVCRTGAVEIINLKPECHWVFRMDPRFLFLFFFAYRKSPAMLCFFLMVQNNHWRFIIAF